MEVPGHDLIEGVEVDRLAERKQALHDAPVLGGEKIERGDEKCARPASGIDDRERAQRGRIITPEGALRHHGCARGSDRC